MARRSKWTHSLCCPSCGDVILELDIPYLNHGVLLKDNHVVTALGAVPITQSLQFILTLLLEAYPHSVPYRHIINVYAARSGRNISEDIDDPLRSIRVQFAKSRKALAAIGLRFETIHTVGYRISIAPEATP